MRLNDAGQMIGRWLHETENKFHDIQCNVSVVMPNHMHFIVVNVGADRCVCPNNSGEHVGSGEHTGRGEHVGSPLRRVVQWFKTMTTNAYIRGVKEKGWSPFDGKLWQRNYYEHIIRDDNDYKRICKYIEQNPLKWALDSLNALNGDNPGKN